MRILETKRTEMAEKVREAHEAAMAKLPESWKEIAERTKFMNVVFNERMSSRAGVAKMKRSYTGHGFAWFSIELNARLLSENQAELIPTYLHELGHVLANLHAGRNVNHDYLWKEVTKMIGGTAERCHKMEVSHLRPKRKRYEYECESCLRPFSLTPHYHAKHNRSLERGSKGYGCRCGKGHLRLKTEKK
jgi:predicted SprT family Zn-dependent metalloprotease